jgi:hypothetical protein
MSFNDEFTKLAGDYSCPRGMGLNITPSVGRFKDGEVPSIFRKGSVQSPAHNASYSMAPCSNYGMFEDKQIMQHMHVEQRLTGSFGPLRKKY